MINGVQNQFTQKLISLIPFQTNGYIFQRVIGNGSFAVVFQVRHIRYNYDYAAKCIPILNKSTGYQEVEILKQLNHPNIILIYDSFEYCNHLILILELCPCTLKNYLSNQNHLSFYQIRLFINCLLDALEYLHNQHIAHRDIKTQNILINPPNRVLLSDFGLSSYFYSDISSEQASIGPFTYRPPELFLHKEPIDPFKVDMWALGVTFYIIAVGHEPWRTYSIETITEDVIHCNYTIPSNIPSDISHVIQMLLVTDPLLRPSPSNVPRLKINKSVRPCKSLNFKTLKIPSSTVPASLVLTPKIKSSNSLEFKKLCDDFSFVF